ncbi:MAG: phosphoribosylglycinamide formyltransferase [Gemmatimonadetes bacterium]|nr:phosphoribosylglycinamide formyltransferase [Gemmatimonadota bacterium]
MAVFASGGGSNLQALLDHFHGKGAPGERVAWPGTESGGASAGAALARVVLVVSDRAGAGALDRAWAAGVEARHVPVAGRPENDVARELLELLEKAAADLVALAGYLRLVPPAVVRRYRGRMLNIHPALLPAFGGAGMYGLRVHEAVLEAGCRVSGVTVHFVDERYDTGPTLIQWPVPVLPGDTPESLAGRVLRVEHRVYPLAVEAVARGVAGGTMGERPGEWPVGAGAPDGPGRPVSFRLAEEEAPGVAEVRRALGIEVPAGAKGLEAGLR